MDEEKDKQINEHMETIHVLLMGEKEDLDIKYIIKLFSGNFEDKNLEHYHDSKTIIMGSNKKVKLIAFDAGNIENFSQENIDEISKNPSAFAFVSEAYQEMSPEMKNMIDRVNSYYPNAVKAIVCVSTDNSLKNFKKRKVIDKEISRFAKQNGALFQNVDCAKKETIDKLFMEIAKKVLKQDGCCSCW